MTTRRSFMQIVTASVAALMLPWRGKASTVPAPDRFGAFYVLGDEYRGQKLGKGWYALRKVRPLFDPLKPSTIVGTVEEGEPVLGLNPIEINGQIPAALAGPGLCCAASHLATIPVGQFRGAPVYLMHSGAIMVGQVGA